MTQEDKELLLKDLCSRLPYGVKVNITSKETKNRIVHLTANNICNLTSGWWSECKPYLFPLSSMSEDQKYEFYLRFIVKDCDCVFDYFKFCLDNGKWHKLLTSLLAVEEIIDWFHKNHLDYRGLIPKGLALDATGLNIY